MRLDDLRNEAEALARELVRAAVRIEHLARLLDDEWRRCSGLRQRLAGIGREVPGTRHKERRR